MLLTALTSVVGTEGEMGPAEAERCIAEIAGGDKNALARLYGGTSAAVYGFAISILKNRHDAEDALQSAYIKLWAAAGGYVPAGKPMAWLLTITKNICYMKLRESRRSSAVPPEEQEGLYTTGDGRMSAEESLLLRGAMEGLTDEQRQIVTLHAVAGLRHREIAGLLGLPLPTVLSKYHRAIKKLKEIMREE